MAFKAYEDACTRAELFGQPLPNKEEFLEKNKHLDVVEFEEVEIKSAENTAMLDEDLKEASGGLSELNTILTSTQTKLNKLKGVCGSLTNFFRIKLTSNQDLSYSSDQSYVGQTNYDNDFATSKPEEGSINQGLGPSDNELTPRAGSSRAGLAGKSKNGDNINTALDILGTMENNEKTSLVSKAAVKDVGKQVTSQMSKLDQMLHQADRAETSLNHQNKQMRSFLR